MSLDLPVIEKNIRKLRKTLKSHKNDLSPDFVHKLRTRVNHVEGWAGALPSGTWCDAGDTLKALAKIRRKAGRVRDRDVFTSLLSSVHVEGESENTVRVLEYLGAERYRRAEDLQTVMHKYGSDVRKGLKQTLKRLDRFAQKQKARPTDQAAEKAAAHVLRLSNELAEPQNLDRRNLHPYRKTIKEMRNVLKLERKNKPQKVIDVLGECKDAIGEWHDWEELIAEATEVVGDQNSSKFLAELRAISERKFDHALAVSNKMRASYLDRAKLPRS